MEHGSTGSKSEWTEPQTPAWLTVVGIALLVVGLVVGVSQSDDAATDGEPSARNTEGVVAKERATEPPVIPVGSTQIPRLPLLRRLDVPQGRP